MKPSFFIVGSPKCGTTALAEYLKSHDDIFVSTPKEPHYFADDFPHYKEQLPDLASYEVLFNNPDANKCKISGEASVWYLYSNDAIKNIKNYQPDAKVIVMLRKPLEVVESLHRQLLWVLDEDDSSLESAWNKQEERLRGQCIPEGCREPAFLQYKNVVDYSGQLKKLYSIFPENQIKLILFDDFKDNTLQVYKDVLEFIGVEYDGKKEFLKVNERKENKNPVLARFTQRPPMFVVYLINFVKKIFGIKELNIMSKLQKINSNMVPREANTELTKRINEELYQSICELEYFLKIDLNNWKS